MELHYSKCENEGLCEQSFQGDPSGSTLQVAVKDKCNVTSSQIKEVGVLNSQRPWRGERDVYAFEQT